MKYVWVVVVVIIILVGVVGYLNKHAIKTMIMGSPTAAPEAQTETVSQSPAETASSGAMMAGEIIKTASDPQKGDYLTDSKGMTLYLYDKDTKGVTNCYGSCATAWPPYTGPESADLPANVTQVRRTDGTIQYAYKGMPLYYYVKDTKPGDLTGDGIGGIWHLVKP